MATRLVVGLGNPGPNYERTRHNVGFRVVRELARRHAVRSWRFKFEARVARIPERSAVVALPQTYMNASGDSVAPLAAFYAVAPPEILVVCDDINLDFAQLRLRRRGSDGGHNGLASIIAALGSGNFPRLRVGVGRTGPDAIDYVLAAFSRDEEAALPELIERAVGGIETYLRAGIEAAIGAVNVAGGRAVEPGARPAE